MKTFIFTNQLTRNTEYEKILKLPILVLFWAIFLATFVFYQTLNTVALLFGALYTYIYIRNLKKEPTSFAFGVTTLEFGEKNLIYKNSDSVIWHIPYERVDKIQSVKHGYGGVFSPITQELLILTRDNDSYSFIGSIEESKIEEIQNEINSVKINGI